MLSEKLLEILCCPVCHGDLLYDREKQTLTCKKCGKIYPIRDNIPIMLVDPPDPPTPPRP